MDPVQLFHHLVNLAAADNKFTDEEITFLVDTANRYNIPSEEFETALDGATEGLNIASLPEDHDDRVKLMKEMLKLMAVDGDLAEKEKRLCAQASAAMNFTIQQFDEILLEVLNEPQL